MLKKLEFEGKTVEDAINKGVESLGVEREDIEFEIVQREHKGILGIGSKPAIISITIDDGQPEEAPAPVKEEKKPEKKEAPKKEKKEEAVPADMTKGVKAAQDFLNGVFSKMGVKALFETHIEKNEIFLNIVSEDKGFIIGRRGETLDALQYLTMLAVNRGSSDHYKITLDIGSYREERVKTLENLAHRLAAKAKKTRRNVSLEPMNAYERKIIHSALQNDKSITTYSVGDEPNRKIVISCKPRKDQ